MNNGFCFVDTGCWIGLLNKDDALHSRADQQYKYLMSIGTRFVTTSAVLTEVANSLSHPVFRAGVIQFYERLQKSSRVEIVFVHESLWKNGWQLFENRLDKEWSLTDCISIVVMRDYEIRDALAYDKHFVQAGFRALLREP
jgi:uncharacterized protein